MKKDNRSEALQSNGIDKDLAYYKALEGLLDKNALLLRLGADGAITYANTLARELLGSGERGLVGAQWKKLASSPDLYNSYRPSGLPGPCSSGAQDFSGCAIEHQTKTGESVRIKWSFHLIPGDSPEALALGIYPTAGKAERGPEPAGELEIISAEKGEGLKQQAIRKEAVNERQQLEGRFRLMFDRHDAVMLLLDPATARIIEANQAAERYYGYTRAKLKTLRIFDINTLPPDEIADELQRAGKEERNNFIFRHRLAGGAVRVVEVHTSPLEIEGQVLLLSIIHDITDRHGAEQELKQSEVFFQSALDALGSNICVIDERGIILFTNQSWKNFTSAAGLDLKDYGIGADYLQICENSKCVDPGQGSLIAKALGEMISGDRESFATEHACVSTGESLWFAMTVTRFKMNDYLRLVITHTDITDRKLAERALQENEKQFRLLTKNSLTGVFMYQDGVFIYVNDRFLEIYGYERHEVAGQDAWMFVHEDFREILKTRSERLLNGDPVEPSVEFRILPKGGAEKWLESLISVTEHEGRPAIMGNVIDITDRKRAEQELQRVVKNLYESNAELRQFAYVASHDLKEPLRNIVSCVQILDQKFKERLGDGAKFVDFAVESGHRMNSLIDGLLAFSRIGTKGRTFAPVDLAITVQEAVINLKSSIAASSASITYSALPVASADRLQLTQLFQNLLGNAIKFSGDKRPEIHVSAELLEHEWLVSISDNGIGIAPQYLERIFSIFQRLHTVAEYPGTGIGLAIAKKIVERHRGRIWAESTPGKGSTFFFTLPEK
jgi:PAS domain S-box-containing protein